MRIVRGSHISQCKLLGGVLQKQGYKLSETASCKNFTPAQARPHYKFLKTRWLGNSRLNVIARSLLICTNTMQLHTCTHTCLTGHLTQRAPQGSLLACQCTTQSPLRWWEEEEVATSNCSSNSTSSNWATTSGQNQDLSFLEPSTGLLLQGILPTPLISQMTVGAACMTNKQHHH